MQGRLLALQQINPCECKLHGMLLCYLGLSVRHGMCRVSEPVLTAEALSKVQTHARKVKQRLAKLQRRQWASGVVSFASKVRLLIPNIDAMHLCAAVSCVLVSERCGCYSLPCRRKTALQRCWRMQQY